MIRRLPVSDLQRIQPLFEAVFKHPISLELLHWKYGDQRGESWLAETPEGQPVVHCGLYFRDVLLDGALVRVAQLVDLMAAPKSNGLARGESPFSVLMRHILAGLPRENNPLGVALGFPSDRAMRLGERMGVYRAVDRWMELEFAPVRARRLGPHHRELSVIDEVDAKKLAGLWAKMAADLSAFAVGVRDVSYVRQRYLAHPEKRYTLLLIESYWLKRPIGLAVIGAGTERRELLDMVCAQGDVPQVIGAAQSWLAEQSGKGLFLSITERFAHPLASLAVRCEPTEFRIMGNPLSPSNSVAALENRWWLTGGDTDYR